MRLKAIVKQSRKLSHPFWVTKGEKFPLDDIDPEETLGIGPEGKARAKRILAAGTEALSDLQDMLYAQDRWAVLLIFQAMDADYPEVDDERRQQLVEARRRFDKE